MNIVPGILPEALYWLAALAFVLLLGLALWRADWSALHHNRKANLLFGSVVALLVLWRMKAGIHPGLDFHLLGATLFVLMFGPAFAFIASSLLVLGSTLSLHGSWLAYPLNVLIMGGVPIALSVGIHALTRRYLRRTFFVYTLVNGYLTGGLAMIATLGVASVILIGFGSYPFEIIRRDYLIFTPMMGFAEGFFTGMFAASLALFKPEWLRTFDDRTYLAGK